MVLVPVPHGCTVTMAHVGMERYHMSIAFKCGDVKVNTNFYSSILTDEGLSSNLVTFIAYKA